MGAFLLVYVTSVWLAWGGATLGTTRWHIECHDPEQHNPSIRRGRREGFTPMPTFLPVARRNQDHPLETLTSSVRGGNTQLPLGIATQRLDVSVLAQPCF
jgi:hypothetical protein